MAERRPGLNWIAVVIAALVYYLLGGLWYSPFVFGRPWRAAIGFQPPVGFRPGPLLYLAPLLGCFAATVATAILVRRVGATTASEGVALGLLVGLGYAAAIVGIDASAPTVPQPGMLFAVVGTYHVVGLVIVASIITAWRARDAKRQQP